MLSFRARFIQFTFACLLIACCASSSLAQQQGNQGIVGANAGAGIVISPEGVLKRIKLDPTGALARKRFLAARAAAKDSRRAELRKVSLNRLEAAVRDRFAAGETMTEEMRFLAGLTRIEYVFFLPESNDIVIAGPAEPWFISSEGEPHGVDSLRPTVRLDDLVVALRAFSPHLPPNASTTIGCSIDPTKQGLANMQQFLSTVGSRARNVNYLVNSLRKAMGMQNVTIRGVSDKSHFAVVMVAADYRMKLIGIGIEKPPVKISSYVDFARPSSRQNALVRWYFTPDYKCVRMSEDGMAMQMVGDRVKLVGADEVVGADGVRRAGGKADAASKKFVQGFTEKYPELAAKVPVYAQLRQLIDLSVIAAFIRHQDYYGKAGWMMDFFGNEETFPVCDYNSPKQVETVVTAVWKGNRLMTPLGGGVVMRPQLALANDKLIPDEGGKVANRRQQIDVKNLPEGKWWWD